MSDVNIFDVTPAEPIVKWFSFENVGDAVQGVYIKSSKGLDSYNNEQMIYELWDRKNNVVNLVGVKMSKVKIIERMNKVSLGQIVGFVRMPDQQTKDKKSTFHPIEVREDPKYVDREWIADYKEREKLSQSVGSPIVNDTVSAGSEADKAFDEMTSTEDSVDVQQAEPPFMSEDQMLQKIAVLANEKLDATPENIKERVMEETNLPFIKANYELIISRLEQL